MDNKRRQVKSFIAGLILKEGRFVAAAGLGEGEVTRQINAEKTGIRIAVLFFCLLKARGLLVFMRQRLQR